MGNGNTAVWLTRLAAGIALSLGLWALPAAAEDTVCRSDTAHLRGPFGQARFTVELADEPKEREIGLMNRESMAASAGMLFVYERPQRVRFWMRNTLIPLDMIFMDRRGVVVKVHHNAVPLDETFIEGGRGIAAVLEINGGMARALGIEAGSQLRHPALDQTVALWPC